MKKNSCLLGFILMSGTQTIKCVSSHLKSVIHRKFIKNWIHTSYTYVNSLNFFPKGSDTNKAAPSCYYYSYFVTFSFIAQIFS